MSNELISRCHVDPDRLALWWCDEFTIRLSGAAAAVLVEEKVLDWRRLQTHRELKKSHQSSPQVP